MNNKTITLTQTPLKQRKKNIRNAHTTEPLAICNIIEKIVLMPFSDFMFCHPEEYASVMEEFTNHKQKWNFPEIPTGMAFQFVAEQTGMSPSARITTGEEAISHFWISSIWLFMTLVIRFMAQSIHQRICFRSLPGDM